jgi:DNA repair protein RecN (Recombination protein N)
MLASLQITNFAIVKELDLDFAQGMTAFTGETGAGKSIMIDALMLALGERADASVVRKGEEKCDISAIFHIDKGSEPALWLSEHDIDAESDEVILRRIIFVEGRSKSTINGHPFPLQKIKEFSQTLVHIHGQHQHQTLMHHQTHRQQLDNFAGHTELLQKVYDSYKECQKINQELENLKNQENYKDKLHLLEFQIEELSALNLSEDEIDHLYEEHQNLHHAKDYLQHSQVIMDYLRAEESPNICRNLNQILSFLNQLPQKQTQIKNALEMINSALIQCEEAEKEIQQFTDTISIDPYRLEQLESRLSALHAAARKYQVDMHQLPAKLNQMMLEVETIKNRENQGEKLKQLYINQVEIYQKSALELRNSRIQYADKLSTEISILIKQLGMPKGRVSIDITPSDNFQAHGLDKVEYKVCTNPGMALDSLSKIASGGELSRISLAIQMITAQRGATPTLLFDEVDVGIGGATAALVGQFLRKLGERLQVFCVTHQPQVASAAHHHFVVEKRSDQTQTFSHIIPLNDQEKIDEIARMMGGLTITEQTRSHARELLLQGSVCY